MPMWQSLVAHASNALVSVVDPVTMHSVQVEEKRPGVDEGVCTYVVCGGRWEFRQTIVPIGNRLRECKVYFEDEMIEPKLSS